MTVGLSSGEGLRGAAAALVPLFTVLFGCADDGLSRPSDGGVDGGGGVDARPGATVVDPLSPESPRPPNFGECRPGWTVVDGDDAAGCEAFPSPVPSCADHEALFPGAARCVRVGAACGDDGWPTGLPAAEVLYVRAGAGAGDGTRGAPFGRIAEATAVARPGTTIALARGQYLTSLALGAEVTLRGACVEGTILRATDAVGTVPVIEVTGSEARIENLTVSGARPGIRVRGAGRTATLEGVIIDAATTVGISIADGAEVEGVDIVIRGTRTLAGAFGRGINVEFGAQLTLTRAVVADNHETAVFVLEGATAQLVDVHVLGTLPIDGFGDALGIAAGSRVTALGCVLEGNRGVGAFATTEATLVMEDSIVRANTQEGIQVALGAAVTLSRTRIEDNVEAGILCDGDGSTVAVSDAVISRQGHRAVATQVGGSLSLTRVLIRDNGSMREDSALYVNGGETTRSTMTLTDVRIASHPSTGILVLEGSNADLERVAIEGTHGTAAAFHTDQRASLRDVHISGTHPSSDRALGRGLEVGPGTEFIIERLHVERVHEVGVLIRESRGSVTDLTIVDVAAGADGLLGHGLEAQGTTMSLARLFIARARGTALFAGSGAFMTASDVAVFETAGNGPLLLSGHAITVNSGARAEITRARLVDNHEATAVVFDADSVLELTDVEIQRSLPRQCTDPRCLGFGGGVGLGVYEGGRAMAQDFIIADSALIGVQLVAGELDLVDGEITGSPIGINVQIPDYPLESHTTGVVLRDNGRNIDAGILPVPDAIGPSER